MRSGSDSSFGSIVLSTILYPQTVGCSLFNTWNFGASGILFLLLLLHRLDHYHSTYRERLQCFVQPLLVY